MKDLNERLTKLENYLKIAVSVAVLSGLGSGVGVWAAWTEATKAKNLAATAVAELEASQKSFRSEMETSQQSFRKVVSDAVNSIKEAADTKKSQIVGELDEKKADIIAPVLNRLPPVSLSLLGVRPDCNPALNANAPCNDCCAEVGWKCLRGLPAPPGVPGDRCDYDATGSHPCLCVR